MNEEQKQEYKRKYNQAKQDGVKFWPDIIYKDLLVSFGLFILLVGLAAFVGVAVEPKADPGDTSYVPRPEWYFLFLFEFLKFVPGQVEWLGTFVIPLLGVITLLVIPFLDKSPFRHWKNRLTGISIMGVVVLGMVGLTIRSVITTPKSEEGSAANTIQEKMILGTEQYGIYCVECHGPDGEGGVIAGVEGLDGVELKPISSHDEMYTRSDETLLAIIEYGQQDLGMPPYGLAYGGELKKAEMEAIVLFMRYTWDDRVELPDDAAGAGAIPGITNNEVPSYEVHLSRVVQRYCISCHRPGKENNDYLMGTYQEILSTGDNALNNLIAGDLNSYLTQTIRGNSVLDENGEELIQQIKENTYALARELKVIGLMNIQYAVKNDIIYVLEVNPRASRTIPFVSKVTGR
ncbi:MAG: c-type cytochrome, partial [Chloroflexi bacterium]|nr:c-type cytochrome [Chloroflexota bacterium]